MKAYQPQRSPASVAMRYALMNLCLTSAAASMLWGKLPFHVTYDKQYFLIILYNTIAVMGQGILALFADSVRNKHDGVRIAVFTFILGLVYPVKFGITAKVIITALGAALFYAFASSSILARSSFRSLPIGGFLAGGAFGLAVATYAPLFGYFGAGLLMMFATPADKDEFLLPQAADHREKVAPKTKLSFLFVPLFVIAAGMSSYLMAAIELPWNTWFRTAVMLYAAIAVGRLLGGIVTDLLGHMTTLAIALGGGSLLLLYCSDVKNLALIGAALLSMAMAPTLSLAFRYLPKHPGFLFALFSGAAYFGQVTAKVHPFRPSLLPLFGGIILALGVAAELVLYVKVRKEEKAHA